MDKELIDGCFYIQEKKWGTYQSHYPDGKGILTSLTGEECISITRWYLKQKQENAFDKLTEKTYSSEVSGKL